MSQSKGRPRTLAAFCVWLALLVGAVVAIALERVLIPEVIASVGFSVMGALLAVRRPHDATAWLMVLIGATPTLALTGIPVEVQNGILIGSLAALLVLFPTGTPPSRVWWIPLVLVYVSWALLAVIGSIRFGDGFELPIGVAVAAGSLAWCATAPLTRRRRAGAVERAQLRWLGAAVGVGVVSVALAAIAIGTGFEPLGALAGLGALAFLIGLPASILVAVTRYRLFEIDRLVSRTITYATLAVFVSAVFAAPVLLAGALAGEVSNVVTAGATLIAAIAVNPLRRRVHLLVDRRFNRSAYDARAELDLLVGDLRDGLDDLALATRTTDMVQRVLQPSSVGVWLRR